MKNPPSPGGNPARPHTWERIRNASWLPAIPLLLLQIGNGLRDMPQFTFFLLYLQERLGYSPIAISSTVAGAQVAGMLTALLGGAISAHLGRKWILICGLALAGLSSFVFQTPSAALVTALWFCSGAGTALLTVGGASYLTHLSAKGALGILAAFYALSMTAGGALGNPLAAWIIGRAGYGGFSWLAIAISSALMALVLLGMPAVEKPSREPGAAPTLWNGMAGVLRRPKLRLLAGLRCLPTIYYGMLTVLIPLLLNQLTGSKALVAGYGTAGLVVASAAQLLAGRIADRKGARLPTLAAFSILLASGLALTFFNNRVWGLCLFGVMGNAAAWSLSTLMYVWVGDGIPKADHPATFGLLHAVWSLSMITGSLLGGWLVSTLPGLPFLTGALINIFPLFLIGTYYASSSPRPPVSR